MQHSLVEVKSCLVWSGLNVSFQSPQCCSQLSIRLHIVPRQHISATTRPLLLDHHHHPRLSLCTRRRLLGKAKVRHKANLGSCPQCWKLRRQWPIRQSLGQFHPVPVFLCGFLCLYLCHRECPALLRSGKLVQHPQNQGPPPSAQPAPPPPPTRNWTTLTVARARDTRILHRKEESLLHRRLHHSSSLALPPASLPPRLLPPRSLSLHQSLRLCICLSQFLSPCLRLIVHWRLHRPVAAV